MFKKMSRLFAPSSVTDDQPNELIGSLIPQSVKEKNQLSRNRNATMRMVAGAVTPIVGVALFAFVTISGYGLVASNNVASALTVSLFDTNNQTTVTIPYGPHDSFSQPSFFVEMKKAFIDDEVTFIEVDLNASTVRYFEAGVLAQSAEIIATGVEGSWWDAPSGLYQVERKQKNNFSSINQTYLPSSIIFEGNYIIHGVPTYPNETQVTEAFTGGGVRLRNEAATELFDAVKVTTPVLVHKTPKQKDDTFVYVPVAPEISTPHFLVADLENGTVLAASQSDEVVPIASLTKLMTAIIVAEKLNLDSRVQVASPSFITSLVPRLAERTSVSMYSLLQLLLVESSNEAAEVIANEYGRQAFIDAMNEKARQLGMLQTSFADPSGLSSENTASAADLYRLTQYIQENRQFIFAITHKGEASAVRGGEFTDLNNFNEVDDIRSFVGGKVGETNAAGQTLISLHEVTIKGSKRTVAVILLGSTSRKEDLRTLLQYIEEQFN